jgi:hypothetical protein
MEAPFIKPITLGSLRKIDSKRIVNAFLEQAEPEVEVITTSTGREFQNVYVSLMMYVKRNKDLRVAVRMSEKRIILSRVIPDDEGSTSSIH